MLEPWLGRIALVGVLIAPWAWAARAEPWLSTRFAQNCASCHAPGRKNLAPSARRCTLSCQGCHANPNGGGLRNQYGKWNEDRVLRMFRSDALRHAKLFAPLAQQHYGGQGSSSSATKNLSLQQIPPLVEVETTEIDESQFQRNGREFEIVERDEYLRQIPSGDPYRLLDERKVDAGGDIRWQLASFTYDDGNPTTPAPSKRTWKSFLMVGDFGIRHRPFYRKLNLVYEFRVQGNPSPGQSPENNLLSAKTRNVYALIDDLPYNIFVMGGLYRPLFGNYVPDHYQLAQEMVAFAVSDSNKTYALPPFKAISLGTAPNVPYLNFHLLGGQAGVQDDRTRGFAANAGLRFVTLGASVNYSYWRTEDRHTHRNTRNEMHSLGLAAKLLRTVTSLEAVSLTKDVDVMDFRQGGVYTLDTYTQIWREFYFTLMHARANVHTDLKPGRAEQTKLGLRAFPIPGVDVIVYYEMREQTAIDIVTNGRTTTKLNGLTSQLHVYF